MSILTKVWCFKMPDKDIFIYTVNFKGEHGNGNIFLMFLCLGYGVSLCKSSHVASATNYI